MEVAITDAGGLASSRTDRDNSVVRCPMWPIDAKHELVPETSAAGTGED
jgi:hypothetical protein